MDRDEVEAHYRQSAFIEDICILERHAVVVPAMSLIRKKKIVNVGDIIRFEMEGLAIGVPPDRRVESYDVWLELLPRTADGKVHRPEVERIVRERQRAAAAGVPLTAADQAWLDDPRAAAAMALVRRRARAGARMAPEANLEIDLGLDSIDRVELLMQLEQRFQIRVPPATACEIFTVRHLIEAVRTQDSSEPAAAGHLTEGWPPHASWSVLLKDLPPETDPILGGLLERKRFAAPIIYAAARLLRIVCRVRVVGLEHVPERGPFLVCPNHQSYADPLFVCGALPYRVFRRLFFVGAVEYFETPLTKWLARTINCVPVDPDSNLVPAMKAGAFGLQHGKVLILFPEGERSIDGTVKKFKKGAPILARHMRVPIVPVALKGIYELWPRNRPLHLGALWARSGRRITVVFGQPMTFSESESESLSDAALRLRSRVDELWRAIG